MLGIRTGKGQRKQGKRHETRVLCILPYTYKSGYMYLWSYKGRLYCVPGTVPGVIRSPFGSGSGCGWFLARGTPGGIGRARPEGGEPLQISAKHKKALSPKIRQKQKGGVSSFPLTIPILFIPLKYPFIYYYISSLTQYRDI